MAYVTLNGQGIFVCDSCGDRIEGSCINARHINIQGGGKQNQYLGFTRPVNAGRDRHYHPESERGCWERPSNDVVED